MSTLECVDTLQRRQCFPYLHKTFRGARLRAVKILTTAARHRSLINLSPRRIPLCGTRPSGLTCSMQTKVRHSSAYWGRDIGIWPQSSRHVGCHLPGQMPSLPAQTIDVGSQTRELDTLRFPDQGTSRVRRIVALGGGTGLPAVLEGLAELANENRDDACALTGIVTVTDDGGSSGRLRRQFGVLPPGDARNCLLALIARESQFKHLLQHRLDEGPGIVGHPLGNLLLTALTQSTGDFSTAIEQLGVLIGSRGRVLPATTANVRLRAELESGETVTGESQITGRGSRIRRLSLDPSPQALPQVLRALREADAIVVGPGSLYTSVLPTLLVDGVAGAIRNSDAVRIFVANLMTEPGETDGYTLDDHLETIRTHTGFDLFDYVLVNRRAPDPVLCREYTRRGARPLQHAQRLGHAGHAQIIDWDLTTECGGRKIRHDPTPLAAALRTLWMAGRPLRCAGQQPAG
jgi:uncharacterized cofD-like protein